MAGGNSIGPRIVIEGEQAFKKSISEINESYKTLKTEMKSVTSEFDKNDKSQKALSAQNEVLAKQIDLQKRKIEETTTMVEKSTAEYGKNAKSTQELQRSLNLTTADMNKLESQLDSNNKSIALQDSHLEKLGKTLETTGGKLKNIGDGMSNVGRNMTLGVTAPIVGLGVLFTGYASDLEENMNKTEVAFKDNAGEVEKWSETTLDAYGISQGAALEMASLFGDMATAMDLPTGTAATMSTSLVGLAGDQ